MSKNIRVSAGCRAAVLNGPQLIALEHALFDQPPELSDAKRYLSFEVVDVDLMDADQIFKFVAPVRSYKAKVFVEGVLKGDPSNGLATDWIIWASLISAAPSVSRVLIRYSAHTRTGCIKAIDRFPEFGI